MHVVYSFHIWRDDAAPAGGGDAAVSLVTRGCVLDTSSIRVDLTPPDASPQCGPEFNLSWRLYF